MKHLAVLPFLLLSACSNAPSPPPGLPPLPSGLAVRAQYPGKLILTDNSHWQMQPAGQSASLSWRPGEPVAVIRSGHPAWPFLLTSRPRRTSALARPFPQY